VVQTPLQDSYSQNSADGRGQGTSILDIGGGIGVIEMELAHSDVGSATVVEASPAYFEVARREVASQSWKKYLLSRWVRKFFL